MTPTVAVVILNYNGRNYLEQFLPFVIKFSQPYEIIVVDNASTDESIPFIKKQYPNIKCIELPENLGYAGGYNQALKEVRSDYFVLLNSDVEVTPNWISPVIQYMEASPQLIACQPKIKSYNNKNYFEYAGAAGGFIDHLGYPFCRGRIFATLEEDKGQYDDNKDVFWATGACLFVKAKQFFELGGFDDQFFAHMEEIDLCWRAKNKGYKIGYFSNSTVYHVGGGTLQAESPFKTYLNFRNNLLMLYKNLNTEEFRLVFSKRKLLDLLAAFQMLLLFRFKNIKALIKAYKDFNQMKSNYKQTTASGLSHLEILPKSIVGAYFLKGEKKYSSLKQSI